MKSRTTRVVWRCVFAILAALPASALAQNYPTGYPSKPVRIILPYLGSTEFAGRWIAAKLAPALGQQVVVDPRPGAGGKIGHELAAKSAPDGHTLMLAAPPLVINPHLYPKGGMAGQDPLRDYAPIAMLGTIPAVLAVHPLVLWCPRKA
jgi:tripartite-type tricarboxylate transporter receptor subunit TctC